MEFIAKMIQIKQKYAYNKLNLREVVRPYIQPKHLGDNIRHGSTKQIRVASCSDIRSEVVPVPRGTWDKGMKKRP